MSRDRSRDIIFSVPEVIDVSSFDSMWPFALGLTALAGLATGIGSLAAIFAKRTNRSFLAASLGFSAGVMIYVSFVELLPEHIWNECRILAHGPLLSGRHDRHRGHRLCRPSG